MAFAVSFGFAVLSLGCDDTSDPDAGPDAGMNDAGPRDAGPIVPDGTVRCELDEQCDDGVGCTRDSCSMDGVCRNQVDPASCDDGIFCNGVELCDTRLGCIPGGRQTCNDGEVCTVDRCDEASKTCGHFPRDLDEDGDPDFFCEGGGDCDDRDPALSSLVNEVCDDLVDNDCDGEIDELDCGRPLYDTCDDPLDVSAGGFFLLDTDGSAPDYPVSCRSTARDLVVTFTLAERSSVTLEAEGDFFSVGVSLRSDCADRESELACVSGFPGVVRRRSLEPGTYFAVVAASSTGEIALTVEMGPPVDPPTNDTCAAPIDVSAGGSFAGSFVETADDVATACSFAGSPDVFYTFTIPAGAAQDVQISALSPSGQPLSYSVRTTCDALASEVRCDYGNPATGILHGLVPGTYFLVLEGPSSREVDFAFNVTFSPATPAANGDSCANPIVTLTDGTPVVGTFIDKENDHDVSCGFRYRDAVHQFTLDTASDVVVELDADSYAHASIRGTCADGASQLRCTSGNPTFQRVRNLAAGTYFVVVEASTGTGYTLSVTAESPPVVPTLVEDNEDCATAHVVPATGGLFRGDTTFMRDDLGTAASCGSGATSNDAAFVLTLASTRRVVLSTDGSTYDTVLHVHNAACAATALHCNDDAPSATSWSFLDRTLTAGTYIIVVDGWGASSVGEYVLEVAVSTP